MQNLNGETEWVVADLTAEQVVLEDRNGATEWVLPTGLLPDRLEEGDVLKVLAEVVREEESVPGPGREPSASRADGERAAGAGEESARPLEEATRHLMSGALQGYEPGDADPVEGS